MHIDEKHIYSLASYSKKIIRKTMQGENFSSTLCSSTLNPIITECKVEPYLYKNHSAGAIDFRP